LEHYALTIGVEAKLACEIGSTVILPAAIRYQTELAQNVATMKAAGFPAETSLLAQVSAPIADLTAAIAGLKTALATHVEGSFAEALHARDELLPAMDAVRAAADALESIVADDLWPLPTYQEMLFIL
jgi:glutamine synthetase